MAIVEQLRVGPMANFAYLLGCEETRVAALVDPCFEPEKLVARAEAQGYRVEWVLNTHGHHDHVNGNDHTVELTGAKVAAHRKAEFTVDQYLKHGDTLRVGEIAVEVLHTPGHARDSVCLHAEGNLFTGDTLFVGECGRTDLPGSDPRAMHRSLFEVLAEVPDSAVIWPGHDYGPRPSSTMGAERRENYVLAPRSLEEFVAFMAEP
ncbi:MAG: MBL fold metallo-hydrolase [Candidatus Poseidoniia archaeon]|nr:MBL fold metallo-hydrolase [Candidatus Poseidoniia archaeon]